LKAEPLKDAARWIEGYRQHWEQRLDRLDAYLQELHGKGTPNKRGRKKSDAQTS
jgi:hypothetical protein